MRPSCSYSVRLLLAIVGMALCLPGSSFASALRQSTCGKAKVAKHGCRHAPRQQRHRRVTKQLPAVQTIGTSGVASSVATQGVSAGAPTPTANSTASTQAADSLTDPFVVLSGTSQLPTAAEPSGQAMPSGDVLGWRQVFADDFTTPVPSGGFSGCVKASTLMQSNCSGLPADVAARWWAYPDGWPDTEHNGQYYPSQVLSVHDGMLDYRIHTSAGGTPLVAAAVPKIPDGVSGGGLRYGAYAVRFRAASMLGYKAAWLLWPDSERWPADGEIDFPEGDFNGSISAFMHYVGATNGTMQAAFATPATFSSWHTAVIEWTPGSCRYILDGQVIGTVSQSVPSDPMHWVLQVETAIDGSVPAPTTAGDVLIDWAAAYVPAS